MNQKLYRQFLLVAGIFMLLIACNDNTSEQETTTTDTTTTTTTEAAPPSAEQQAGPDALQVAPNLYKVLSDTAGIRILEATYKPGDSSAMHAHPVNALYVVQGGTVTFTGTDGTSTESTLKTGATAVRPAESHSARNTGNTTIKAILVEVSRSMQPSPQDTAMDAVRVAPNRYKLKNDSLGLRIIEISYKPGDSSALHAHPEAALYVIQGGTSEFTMQDGSKQTLNLPSRTALVMPAGTHRVKNVGKTTTRSILVETNRQGN